MIIKGRLAFLVVTGFADYKSIGSAFVTVFNNFKGIAKTAIGISYLHYMVKNLYFLSLEFSQFISDEEFSCFITRLSKETTKVF